MNIKKRIEEVVQNGTLQSGEEITYIETDELYAILDDIANSSNYIQNVSEPLGFFEFMDDRYYISEIDGGMLTGWRLTPAGMRHTMTIHKDSVTEYVKSVS